MESVDSDNLVKLTFKILFINNSTFYVDKLDCNNASNRYYTLKGFVNNKILSYSLLLLILKFLLKIINYGSLLLCYCLSLFG